MKAWKRADLINGSLVFFLAIQSATSLFILSHRAFDMPLATLRGMLGIEIPWLCIWVALAITAVAATFVGRYVIRTSSPETTVEHVVSAKLWVVGYGILTVLLTVYYLNTFTPVFRS